MTPLRVAIVGAGMMGRWHAYYALRAGATLAAIVEPEPQAVAEFRNRFAGTATFMNLQDCLARCQVDVVHICTTSSTHESLAQMALQAGKHVLVEKPAARSRAAAERLIELAARSGLRINPVHQFPFQRGFRKLQRHLDRLGRLVRINCLACTAGADGLTEPARHDRLLEILPHPISLFRAISPGSLDRSIWTVASQSKDELEVSGVSEGLHLSIQISLCGRPPRNELTVIGTAGTAHLNLFHGFGTFESGRASRSSKLLQPFSQASSLFCSAASNLLHRSVYRQPAFPGLPELIAAFHRSIRENQPPPIHAHEILETVSFMEQVRSLAAQNTSTVSFSYPSIVASPSP